jgi:hypothetical protein
VSVALHCAIVLLLLILNRTRAEEPLPPPQQETRIALDPPVRYQETPPDQPPPPPDRPIPLGPDSDRPDAPVAQEQGRPDPIPEDAPRALDSGGTPDAAEAPDEQTPDPQRIPTPADLPSTGVTGPPTSPFGRFSPLATLPPSRTTTSAAGTMGRAGFGEQDTRGFRQSFENAAGQCVRIPDPGVNPDGSPVLFSVLGIVRDDRGRPLPNAHLQLVGQVYATFTDGSGNYRLEFNPKLLDECRVQVVRVSADGYRGADLQLAIGRRVQSDDVFLKRR